MFSSKKSGGTKADDMELAARCVRGELGAFEELYKQHATRLYSLAYRMAGTSADAEELVQEAFLLAHRKLDTFKGESALGTWLYRLTVNLCVDHLRSKQTKASQRTESLDDEPWPARRPAAAPTTELTLTRLDLERAIAKLPDSYRSAFLLHDVEGFEHKEVGDLLGIAEGTSKSLVHKARMKLRGMLDGKA